MSSKQKHFQPISTYSNEFKAKSENEIPRQKKFQRFSRVQNLFKIYLHDLDINLWVLVTNIDIKIKFYTLPKYVQFNFKHFKFVK